MQTPPATPATVKLVVLGDSLTAGFGLPAAAAFPVVLQQALKDQGLDVEVVNHGISGDTTAGGLARVQRVLAENPHGVIVELGANDGLRGLDPGLVERNLSQLIRILQEKNIAVFLAGMRALSNMGPDYSKEFAEVYERLAKTYRLPFYPFFLEGVAMKPEYSLPDGLHPNEAGVREVVRRITPSIAQFVRDISRSLAEAGRLQNQNEAKP